MQPEVRPGEEFAGHRIDRVIGRGGISVVYLAEHLRLGRKVALKVLFPHLADDPGFRDRFIKESRTAAALDHPNIVSVYDAGEVDGLLYLSMRYVEGSDLDRVLRDTGTLDAWRTITIASQVASALDAAHVEGLVHRDVKPGNILLSAPGTSLERAYLADFGITKRMDTREALTRTGQFVGTVDYVAPEQILGQPVDGRTDVYSLGCVLYRCVTGAPPFPRPTDVATIYAHLHDEPAPMVATPVPGFDGVIVRALAKSKEDRYPTCVALVEAARSHLEASDRTQVLERPETEEIPRPPRRPVRGRRMAAVAGALALLVVVTASLLLMNPPRDPLDPSTTPPATEPPTGAALSPTTTAWTVTPWSAVEDGSTSGQVVFTSAAVTGGGVVFAAGHADELTDELDEDAVLWRLDDEDRWVRQPLPGSAGPGNQRIWDVVSVGNTIIAVGYDAGTAAVWMSEDAGTNWRAANVEGDANSINTVTPVEDGSWLAFGVRESDGGTHVPLVWVSEDGERWTIDPVATDEMEVGIPQAAVTSDGVTIVVGSVVGPDGTDAAIWESGPDGWFRVDPELFADAGEDRFLAVAALNARVVAVGVDGRTGVPVTSLSGDGLIWSRDAQGRWRPARFPVESWDTFLSSVTSTGSWFLTAGHAADGSDDNNAAVWWSDDGVTWERQDPTSPRARLLSTRKAEEIRALLFLEERSEILAFGEQTVDPGSGESHARLWEGHHDA